MLTYFITYFWVSRQSGTQADLLYRMPSSASLSRGNSTRNISDDEIRILGSRGCVLDEVPDIIEMPKFDPRALKQVSKGDHLDPLVRAQVHENVERVAAMYRNHPFHNFKVSAANGPVQLSWEIRLLIFVLLCAARLPRCHVCK